MKHPIVHLWTPGLTDFKGGIQVYSSYLLAALNRQLPGHQLRVFSLHDQPIGAPKQPGVAPPMMDDAGATDASVPPRVRALGQWPVPLRSLAFAGAVLGSLLGGMLRRQPQIIISTHLHLAVVAHWLKHWFGLPYWVVAHGFEAWEITKPSVQQALLQADRVLAVSSYTRDRLLQNYDLKPETVHLLPNTLDESRFQIAPKPQHLLQRHGLRSDQPILLTVNRLAAGEDFHPYDQVLAALLLIRQALPEIHYIIVGEGGDRPRLEKHIQELGLGDCVTLTGFIHDEELPHYYNLCDGFAMPSKLEGFGIVCLEAMASGKPVLASQVDGSSHALLQGELGLLIDPEDISAIAAGLVAILQGSHGHPLLGRPHALRQRMLQAFGQDAFQRQLQQHLREAFPLAFSPATSFAAAPAVSS